MSKIDQIIDDIEAYLADCKAPTFSGAGKLIIERDVMENLVDELRINTPEEIKKYQRLVAQKEEIIANARRQADLMIEEAQKLTEKMVNEHEISQKAYEKSEQLIDTARQDAQDIVDSATSDANAIRVGAIQYTDDLLSKVQEIVENAAREQEMNNSALMTNYQDILTTVRDNRGELDNTNVVGDDIYSDDIH